MSQLCAEYPLSAIALVIQATNRAAFARAIPALVCGWLTDTLILLPEGGNCNGPGWTRLVGLSLIWFDTIPTDSLVGCYNGDGHCGVVLLSDC